MPNKTVAIVALMAVFSLAVCFIILGSISSDLQKALNIDNDAFGSLVMTLLLTSCVVQLFIGPAVDRFGYRSLAIIGFVVSAGSIFLLAFADSFSIAFIACMLLGLGAMALNTVGNTLIPVVLFEGKDPARASNFGNGFFGLGYVAAPFLFTLFLQKLGMSYRLSLSIFGILMLVFLVFSLAARYPRVPIGFQLGKALSLLGKGPVLIAALALFCYISLEFSMGAWIRKLFEELLATNADKSFWAGMVLVLFGVSMTVGRFVSSAIKNLTSIGVRVITCAAVVSLIGIVMMILTHSAGLAVLAVIITGLAFAPIFPTIVGVTFSKFDSSLYGSIFGIIFAVGLFGGALVQKYIGVLSASSSVQSSLTISAVVAAVLIVISLVMGFSSKPAK
jgi:fucose permease